jgi:hypothetical protein
MTLTRIGPALVTSLTARQYTWMSGSTSFVTRAYENSIPGPTIVVPVGQALPTTLVVNLTMAVGTPLTFSFIKYTFTARDETGAPGERKAYRPSS